MVGSTEDHVRAGCISLRNTGLTASATPTSSTVMTPRTGQHRTGNPIRSDVTKAGIQASDPCASSQNDTGDDERFERRAPTAAAFIALGKRRMTHR